MVELLGAELSVFTRGRYHTPALGTELRRAKLLAHLSLPSMSVFETAISDVLWLEFALGPKA